MNITGTKKLLLILLSLVCALAVGLGVTFALSAERGKASYAQTEESTSENEKSERTDEEVLNSVAEKAEMDYELVNFFSNVIEISPNELEQVIEENGNEAIAEMANFISSYAAGEITTVDVEDEDWYIAPDEVGNYSCGVGLQYVWSEYYTSKSGYAVTDESWTNDNYAYGMCHRWNMTVISGTPAGQAVEYMWVTLDPGEEYEYGLKSLCKYGSITTLAYDAPTFFNSSLKGYWFTADFSGNYVGSDPAKTPLTTYEKEYATNIAPSTNYISRKDSYGNAAGTYRAVISGDAPSGVYGLRFYDPFVDGSYFMTWGGGRYVMANGQYCPNWYSTKWCDYVIIVKRNAPDKVLVEYDTGVDNTRLNKTSTFTGEALQIGVQGDWGAGLITFTQSYTPLEAGSTATSSLTTVYRAAAGGYVHYYNDAV